MYLCAKFCLWFSKLEEIDVDRQLPLAIHFKMSKHMNYSSQSQLKFVFIKLTSDLSLTLVVKKYFKINTVLLLFLTSSVAV